MTYACPTWELAADTCLLKLQRMQNVPRCTRVRCLHAAFNLSYAYDYITRLSKKQAEVIQNHENEHVRNLGQGEVRHRKYKRLKLGGGQAYDRSSD
jgi:hypothetical protein